MGEGKVVQTEQEDCSFCLEVGRHHCSEVSVPQGLVAFLIEQAIDFLVLASDYNIAITEGGHFSGIDIVLSQCFKKFFFSTFRGGVVLDLDACHYDMIG